MSGEIAYLCNEATELTEEHLAFIGALPRCRCREWRPGYCCLDVEKVEPRIVEDAA